MGKDAPAVVHIDTERTWRGGQRQAHHLLKAMHQQGYRVTMVCQPGSPLERACEEGALPCLPVAMPGEFAPVSGWRIARHCRAHSYTVLHAHSAHALSVALWTKLWHSDLALIAVRRVDFHIKGHWLSRFKYTNAYVDRIVCVCEAIRQVLLSDGVPPDKLVTIHSGVDLQRFHDLPHRSDARRRMGIPRDRLVVGTVAALARHKDYPNLLEAARIVLGKRDDVVFCAVGQGPEESRLLRMARSFELYGKFVFAGFQKDPRTHLPGFDVFVLASRREGFGGAVVEAQAVGIPVVACHTGGLPEVVQHERNGLLVPPRDPAALAEAILRLLADPQLRTRLGANGRRHAEKFSIEASVEKNLQLYQTVSSRGSPAT